MMLWHIGNTTVRSPYRLREALRLLSTSALQGNLSGKRQEEAFAQQLHAANIVSSTRLNQASENRADDLGRKWRAALMQLGFLTPKLSKAIDGGIDHELLKYTKSIAELTGRPFEITPNGYRLLNSETVGAMQDCFLRALLAYRIPSQIESRYQMPTFSPIHFLLKVFTELSAHNYEAILSFHEYALFVQTSHYGEPIPILLNQMMAYRHGRAAVKGRIKSYDKYHYDQIAEKLKKKAGTLKDYADLSLRYLKATGLFQTTGRGITIAKSKQALVKLLMEKSPI
ncbi:MAG: AlwI family type II restriction endonuclease, partial [Gammaproteobacteria bacterium]|nr:AlwI family type II restriction endonuclease [Gammaproteobacteria bacterium]